MFIDLVYCPNMCGLSFTRAYRKRNLNMHLNHECNVKPKFQCRVCLKIFAHKSSLKTHVAVIHHLVL